MKLILSVMVACLFVVVSAFSQDTTAHPAVKGGIYDRPYLVQPSSRLAIGGYAETMLRSEYADGVHENISFEARRFNIFFFSSISPLIKLTSELEFEHGTEEIKLETALIDLLLHEALNVRGGIILSPLGRFNISHDSPRNEFTDRPLVSTQIIPTTLSEAGFGVHGLLYPIYDHRLTYEMYLVNGFTDDVVLTGDGTFIPAGRPVAFEEDNNGNLAFVGRLAVSPEFGGELGGSLHTGFYNTFKKDGLDVDAARRLTIAAVDWSYDLGDVSLIGEYAHARIEIPASLQGLFAERQQGVYLQLMYRALQGVLPMFPRSVLGVGVRYDYVDMDADTHGSDTHRLTAGVNVRLVPETVVKLDYQHDWSFDRINNESKSAVVQFGIATYF